MPHNVGYCCINMTLQKQKITTGRGMIQRTFKQKGLEYASELALANAIDLVRIIQWNEDNGVKVFRMGSGIFPWGSEYNLTDLPQYSAISKILETAGKLANQYGQRITAHPDHFVKLASSKENVVLNSIKDLELHSTVFDMMGLSATPYNAMNIHVGMNFCEETAERWVTNFKRLSPNCQARLTVENDDKETGFSVVQLFAYIYSQVHTPITFDYFHHQFHPDGWDSKDAAHIAAGTWPQGIKPLFHYSESKNINENVSGNPRAHADYVFSRIDDYGLDIDVDLECKKKELALFKYLEIAPEVS